MGFRAQDSMGFSSHRPAHELMARQLPCFYLVLLAPQPEIFWCVAAKSWICECGCGWGWQICFWMEIYWEKRCSLLCKGGWGFTSKNPPLIWKWVWSSWSTAPTLSALKSLFLWITFSDMVLFPLLKFESVVPSSVMPLLLEYSYERALFFFF